MGAQVQRVIAAFARPARVARALLAVVVVAALALAPSAPGAGTPKPVTVRDGIDAMHGAPDLVLVQLGVAPSGRLRAVLGLAAPWLPRDLLARRGPPGSLCLRLWTRSKPGATPPDYLVCVTARADGETTRGSVLRVRAGRPLQRVAGARVGRTSQSDATLRFSQAAIGRPGTVRFAAEATKAGCGGLACVDTAPAAPRTATLRVRRGT